MLSLEGTGDCFTMRKGLRLPMTYFRAKAGDCLPFSRKGHGLFLWNSVKLPDHPGPGMVGRLFGTGQERSACLGSGPVCPTFAFSLGLDGSTFKDKCPTFLPSVQQTISFVQYVG